MPSNPQSQTPSISKTLKLPYIGNTNLSEIPNALPPCIVYSIKDNLSTTILWWRNASENIIGTFRLLLFWIFLSLECSNSMLCMCEWCDFFFVLCIILTVSAHIPRRRLIKKWGFYGEILLNKTLSNWQILLNKVLKWRLNQEWRRICADTVVKCV